MSSMLVLLSPSKTQEFGIDRARPDGADTTSPRLLKDARQVMEALRSLSRDERLRRLRVSATLEESFEKEIASWSGSGRKGVPAAFAYTGETYRGLAIRSLSSADLASAQRHIRILSALYGMLRPLDRIEPYRLDYGCSLQVDNARSLYDFWTPRLTRRLAKDVAETGAEAVLNLASAEFARSIDAGALGVPFITPDFAQRDGEKLKRITVFSKQARGTMARWAASAEIACDQIPAFSQDGYEYEPEMSTAHAPVFVRNAR